MSIGIWEIKCADTGLAGFLYGEDFAALILSALLADAVGQLALVAVGTLSAGGSEVIVAAAFWKVRCLEWRRFRIRHFCSLSIGPRLRSTDCGGDWKGPVRLRFRANRV